MPPRNPTADVEPNFEEDHWEGARTAIMGGGKTAEEANEILRQAWKGRHERDLGIWNEHLQQLQQEGGEDEQIPEVIPEHEELAETEMPDWLDKPTPSFLDIKPACNILKRLEKKEFIELWHFTAEGCRNAAAVDLASPDETFGLVNTEKGLLFQNIGASVSSAKTINDENLTWNQLTEAKTRMIGCLKDCKWKSYEIEQLMMFYLGLDVHLMHSRPYGLDAIMRYQDRVQRDWTARLSNGDPYRISEINDDLMKEIRDEIRNEDQARNNISFSPSCFESENRITNLILYHQIMRSSGYIPTQMLSASHSSRISCNHRSSHALIAHHMHSCRSPPRTQSHRTHASRRSSHGFCAFIPFSFPRSCTSLTGMRTRPNYRPDNWS